MCRQCTRTQRRWLGVVRHADGCQLQLESRATGYSIMTFLISENWTTLIDLAVNVIVTMHDIWRYVVFMFFLNKRKWSEMKINDEVDYKTHKKL